MHSINNTVSNTGKQHSRGTWLRRTSLALALAGAMVTQSWAVELPSFNELVKQYGPAVVNIRATGMISTRPIPKLPEDIPEPFRRFFRDLPGLGMPQGSKPQAQGSGFVISQDGYILTNAHVVAGAKEVLVRLDDRREYPAKVIGSDEHTDIALLKIDASHLPTVKLGDSDKLKVGDWVLAIGSPFGFERTATQGIVSALSRNLPDDTYVPFIQTDAPVNPGNSGGPLFDTDGNVAGINSQIYSHSGGYMGLSFAIPINVALKVTDQLKTKGYVERGWLGVAIQDMDQPLAQSFGLEKPEGALVSSVTPDSPADKAGIKVGDVILRYDGKTIERSGNLPPLVGNTAVGTRIPVEVLRDGKTHTLALTVGELKEKPAALAQRGQAEKGALGVMVADLDAQQRKALNLDHGVLISDLAPNSPAEAAGLQPEDIILSFNHQEVKSVAQLQELVKQAPTGKAVPVQVQREQNTLFLPIIIPDKGVS
jgi:serine protease Do